jgi:predicted ester cyclase
MMSYEELRSISQSWMKFWQGEGLDNFDNIHDENFIDYSPSGRSPDRAGFRQGIEGLYAAFPDFRADIEDIIIDTKTAKAAISWSATGTHQGEFLGHAATNNVINFHGIEIIKISGGKIIERWGEWNGLGLIDQLSEKL